MRNYQLRLATVHSDRRPCSGCARPGGGGRIQRSTGASSQTTLQETVCAQAQGGAGGHQDTSATCGCSFLVPSLSQSSATAAPAAAPADGARAVTANQPGCRALWALGGGPVESAQHSPECPQGSPALSSLVPPGMLQAGCAHTLQGHGIARWPGSWAFLLAPAKAGLHGVWLKGSWAGAMEKRFLAS